MKSHASRSATILSLAVALSLAGCLTESENSSITAQGTGDSGGSATNSAPTISGNPQPAVTINAYYTFTPAASDPDGDTLTFIIENSPAWASFDTATGTVSGTPTLANIGIYSNILISVSDGQAAASLSRFQIEVTQVALGSVNLSWTAPTQNEDGTMLTDLAGYVIHYGTSSGNYANEIRINNASVTTYLVDNLTPDTYFFATTAFNSSGIHSRFSGEAVAAVN